MPCEARELALVLQYYGTVNNRPCPSRSANVRSRLEALVGLPYDAAEWVSFMGEEIRLPSWMLPAVQAAVRQAGWRTTADPIPQIIWAVRRLAIEMRLSNPDNTSPRPAATKER